MDAVGPRPHVVGRLGWHRFRAVGRVDEAICGRLAVRHVLHSIVGGRLVVFGVGTHFGVDRHSPSGPALVGWRPPWTGHPLDFTCHLHAPWSHETDLDVCPRRHERVVGGFRGLGRFGGPSHAGWRCVGFGSGLSNPQALSSSLAADRVRGSRVTGGHVQGSGCRNCVCSGGHHD